MIHLLFTGGTISMSARYHRGRECADPWWRRAGSVRAGTGGDRCRIEVEDWGKFPASHLGPDRLWSLRNRVHELVSGGTGPVPTRHRDHPRHGYTRGNGLPAVSNRRSHRSDRHYGRHAHLQRLLLGWAGQSGERGPGRGGSGEPRTGNDGGIRWEGVRRASGRQDAGDRSRCLRHPPRRAAGSHRACGSGVDLRSPDVAQLHLRQRDYRPASRWCRWSWGIPGSCSTWPGRNTRGW